LNYRSDIDGLRTIAVFLVILNHAGFSLFTGGFVGVDVFFVISGFLITSIIYPRLIQNNFSFTWFLSRRIKRLMPVLLFVILVCSIVFSFVLLPQDLQSYYKSTIYVILYVANFFFWRENGGYFDGGSEEVVLLHTWSLAVEEQYYLIWPLILALFIKFLGAKKTIVASIALCVFSTVFSQWGTDITIGAAYYLLPTRFFELLVGSCLALAWSNLPSPNKITSHILSLIGLALIVSSALLLNEYSSFPGYNGLYPVIGTALIIYASSNGIVNRILALKPIVFTGNISYSLYLWHWPILVLFRYTNIELTLFNQLLAITITYLLAVLSWKYIEQPTRHMKVSEFKEIITKFYIIPSTALIVIAIVGLMFNGYPKRFSNEIVAMEKAVNTYASESRKLCHSPYRSSENLPNDMCIFNTTDNNTSTDIFIFGDSHANHIVPFIHNLAKDADVSVQDYTLDRCVPIFDLKWGSNLHLSQLCKKRNDLALEHIKSNHFKYVVLGASWPGIQTKRIFTDTRVENNQEKEVILTTRLESTLQAIVNNGATPVILADLPTLGGKSPKCTLKKELFDPLLDCGIYKTQNLLFSKLILLMQNKFPQLIIIRPADLFCSGEKCTMDLQNTPLYRDEDHLNELGASILGTEFLKTKTNPFKQ
jgi:peptidoglycan/LPS O-acetylase OafA/YrhL